MKIDIENLPKSQETLRDMVIFLHQSLHQKQDELAIYKLKYASLIEQISLAKQQRFAPSSEKNVLQQDLFDEAGIQLPEEVIAQLDYEYHETRGGYHAEQFLKGFKGYLQSDAYSGYNWADKNKDIISVGCNAHARRPFAELVKLTKGTSLAAEAVKFYRKLYKIEEQARENNLSTEKRYVIRQEESKPVCVFR